MEMLSLDNLMVNDNSNNNNDGDIKATISEGQIRNT